MRKIPDNSIDMIITSPPYFQQREYGGGSTGNEYDVENYIIAVMDVFRESVRVIKNTGNIVINMGDKYQNGNLMLIPYRFAIEVLKTKDDSVRLVNDITWVKTNPTPRQFKRRLVSSTEPFFHFVKSNSYYYDYDEYQKTNKIIKQSKPTSRLGQKYCELIEKSELSQKQKKYALKKLNETVCKVKNGALYSFRMKIKGIHSPAFGGNSGGRHTQIIKQGFTIIELHGNKMKKDVVMNSVESIKGNLHPATYPESVISELIKLLSPKCGIVLDPYMGSGTTGVAAKKLNRSYIGFDIIPEYCEYAKHRIEAES